jgi:hypothetical protein
MLILVKRRSRHPSALLEQRKERLADETFQSSRPPIPSSRLVLEVDIGERLALGVADDEAGVRLIDRPGRREADRRLMGFAGAGARRDGFRLGCP